MFKMSGIIWNNLRKKKPVKQKKTKVYDGDFIAYSLSAVSIQSYCRFRRQHQATVVAVTTKMCVIFTTALGTLVRLFALFSDSRSTIPGCRRQWQCRCRQWRGACHKVSTVSIWCHSNWKSVLVMDTGQQVPYLTRSQVTQQQKTATNTSTEKGKSTILH